MSSPPGFGCSPACVAAAVPAADGVGDPVPPCGWAVHADRMSATITTKGIGRRRNTVSIPPRAARGRAPEWAELYAARLARQHLFIDVDELSRDVRPVEIDGAPRARRAETIPQRGIVDELCHGPAQRVRILRLDEEPRHTPLYDLLVAVDVGGDDGASGGHRLEQHDPERLLPRRRRAEDVGRLVKARLVDVRDAAGEEDVAQTLAAHEPAHLADLRARAREDEPHLRIRALQRAVRAKEVHRALPLLGAPDEEDVHLSVAVLRERARARE